MTFKDFLHIQNYFREEEKRDPSSDGDPCAGYLLVRSLPSHHIFHRADRSVTFGEGDYRKPMEDTYRQYLQDHSEIFTGAERISLSA